MSKSRRLDSKSCQSESQYAHEPNCHDLRLATVQTDPFDVRRLRQYFAHGWFAAHQKVYWSAKSAIKLISSEVISPGATARPF